MSTWQLLFNTSLCYSSIIILINNSKASAGKFLRYTVKALIMTPIGTGLQKCLEEPRFAMTSVTRRQIYLVILLSLCRKFSWLVSFPTINNIIIGTFRLMGRPNKSLEKIIGYHRINPQYITSILPFGLAFSHLKIWWRPSPGKNHLHAIWTMDHLKILPQPLTRRNFTKLHLKDDDDDDDDDDDYYYYYYYLPWCFSCKLVFVFPMMGSPFLMCTLTMCFYRSILPRTRQKLFGFAQYFRRFLQPS